MTIKNFNIKGLGWFLALGIIATSCSEDNEVAVMSPSLDAGSADFSTFVSVGNSLTAGRTDSALFIAAQENSFPNIMAQKMALVGGGDFRQPLMADNIGGLTIGGSPIEGPRLYLNMSTMRPAVLDAMPTTDLLNSPAGPFNNMGVPGANSFHLLAPGYGNLANLSLGLANPYFIRMASSPNATVLQDVVAQSPTFFTMWVGSNDILGYATSGAPSGSPFNGVNGTTYTDPAFFEFVYGNIIGAMTAGGAQGVVANIPDVLSIPFFHTIAYNPVPMDAGTAAFVNSNYDAYNNGLLYAASVGLITAEEAAFRTISFEASETNAFVITDDELTDLTGLIGLPSLRQTKPTDLVTLTTGSVLGTLADPNNPASVLGVAVPLGDANVLTTAEQGTINGVVTTYNGIIASAVNAAGLAFMDAHTIFNNVVAGNYTDLAVGDNQIGANLVLGGGFSLDGVHMTARGYALIANEMLKAIDAKYGSNFEASGSLVDLGDYPTNYSPLLQ